MKLFSARSWCLEWFSMAKRNGLEIHLAAEYSQQFSNRNRILRVINCAGRCLWGIGERKSATKFWQIAVALIILLHRIDGTIQSVRLCDYNKLIKFALADNPPCDVTDRREWEKIEFIITINSYTNASFEFNDQPRSFAADLLLSIFLLPMWTFFRRAMLRAVPFHSSVWTAFERIEPRGPKMDSPFP